jgi:hypothetical protein
MLSYSKQIYTNEIQLPHLLSYQPNDIYKFVRIRLGNQTTKFGEKYRPYLYRNIHNNILVSSWNKPTNKELYTSCDIGMNADALIYYKNE